MCTPAARPPLHRGPAAPAAPPSRRSPPPGRAGGAAGLAGGAWRLPEVLLTGGAVILWRGPGSVASTAVRQGSPIGSAPYRRPQWMVLDRFRRSGCALPSQVGGEAHQIRRLQLRL